MATSPEAHPGAARRARNHLRWRLQQFRSTTGTQLFLDPSRDAARCCYLSSWPRSGSTWLAELLCSARGTRLVFEPANMAYPGRPEIKTDLVSLPRVGPEGSVGGAEGLIEGAVTGRLRSHWSDQITTTHLARRRVVKDIVGVGALPWICGTWPEMPAILLIRHPLAVAHSLVELTWSMNNASSAEDFVAAHAQGADPSLRAAALLREVEQWAADHAFALGRREADRALVVFYEELVEEPRPQIRRIADHLAASSRAFRSLDLDMSMIERPSFASFRRTSATKAERVAAWAGSYDDQTIAAAIGILRSHGLGGVYGAGPEPLVDAGSIRSALRGPEVDEGRE